MRTKHLYGLACCQRLPYKMLVETNYYSARGRVCVCPLHIHVDSDMNHDRIQESASVSF